MYREQSGRGNCAVTDGRILCCREISFAVGFMHFGVVMFWVKLRHSGHPPSVSFPILVLPKSVLMKQQAPSMVDLVVPA